MPYPSLHTLFLTVQYLRCGLPEGAWGLILVMSVARLQGTKEIEPNPVLHEGLHTQSA